MSKDETVRAEYTFSVPVPPQEAFARISDPEQDPEWQAAVTGVTLRGGEPRPGCRYDIVFQLIGKRMEFTVEIDEFEPGRLSKFHTLSGPVSYQGTYAYTANEDGGTDVHWTFDVQPGDYFGIMPKTLLRKVLINSVKKDSGKLAARLGQEARTR
ncbi:carbon monoxide dehydrogenase subunit G [Streptomyces sp. B3I7]|jgi:carbon monoxide dehydrogenase subunit G|uniref:SRPBCC family protein n=1 Tax=unclassified Streptomyces TaxID=2593676 RepID=UPI00277E98FA|nr:MULTISPECIES: SRPBCC family protein [unclassified Streptomyces]MDQ0785508.1 carbon monoxide dehydrogenase subunit G [Streptomyces sp. B3I8]MDQ0814907.1 carbon monoxide dehydrogenase subunit G [Streptomyces sp. B3I7]